MFDRALERVVSAMFWLSLIGIFSLGGGTIWLIWFLIHHVSFH